MFETITFELKQYHIDMVCGFNVDYSGFCEWGSVGCDCKRPFGNGDMIGDMAKILGVQPIETDDGEVWPKGTFDEMQRIYKEELATALEVILESKSFVPGVYEKENHVGKWQASNRDLKRVIKMSRDIKFRAWDKHNNKMIAPHDGDFIGWHAMNNWKDCLEVMQYTGLTDKHGKEIYEGDLLRIPAKNEYENSTYNCFEVFYHDNDCIGEQNIGFCMNRMHCHGNSAGGMGYKFTPNSIRDNGFEVIGNIYENPDLM